MDELEQLTRMAEIERFEREAIDEINNEIKSEIFPAAAVDERLETLPELPDLESSLDIEMEPSYTEVAVVASLESEAAILDAETDSNVNEVAGNPNQVAVVASVDSEIAADTELNDNEVAVNPNEVESVESEAAVRAAVTESNVNEVAVNPNEVDVIASVDSEAEILASNVNEVAVNPNEVAVVASVESEAVILASNVNEVAVDPNEVAVVPSVESEAVILAPVTESNVNEGAVNPNEADVDASVESESLVATSQTIINNVNVAGDDFNCPSVKKLIIDEDISINLARSNVQLSGVVFYLWTPPPNVLKILFIHVVLVTKGWVNV